MRGIRSKGIRRSVPGQIAVHREGDADTAEQQVGFRALACDCLVALLRQPPLKARVVWPHGIVMMTHLVIASHVTPRSCCRIEGECAAHSVFDERSSKRYATELFACETRCMHAKSASRPAWPRCHRTAAAHDALVRCIGAPWRAAANSPNHKQTPIEKSPRICIHGDSDNSHCGSAQTLTTVKSGRLKADG